MLIAPAEELGDGDDDPEWQETQSNADVSTRLAPGKRMILFMKLSSMQIKIGADTDWPGLTDWPGFERPI
jgi:hypothetical protein